MIKPPIPPDLEHCRECGKFPGDHKGGSVRNASVVSPRPFARPGDPLGATAALVVSATRMVAEAGDRPSLEEA